MKNGNLNEKRKKKKRNFVLTKKKTAAKYEKWKFE